MEALGDELTLRLRGRSPRWMVALIGLVLVLVVFGLNLASGTAHGRHQDLGPGQGAVYGAIVILGLLLIVTASTWSLWTRRRPQ